MDHKLYLRRQNARAVKKARAGGKCLVCRKKKAAPGLKYCSGCREYQKVAYWRRKRLRDVERIVLASAEKLYRAWSEAQYGDLRIKVSLLLKAKGELV